MQHLALIAVGGSIGAVARYGLSLWLSSSVSPTFPIGTFVVNMLGSLVIGALFELSESTIVSPEWRGFLMIGLLGAFTTFSTFSLETVQLLRDSEPGLAALNVLGSVLLGIGGVYAGMHAVKLTMKLIA